MLKNILLAGALAATLLAPAVAQDARVHVRGKIVSLAGNVLTVAAPVGDSVSKVTLAPDYKVQYVVKATLADIKSGSFVGSAATTQPDGSMRAIEVHIFPPGLTPGQGSRPYDLGPASTMTNGTVTTIADTKVDTVNGTKLLVNYEGGSKEILVVPSTVIVTYAPATAAALAPGGHVNILATKNADGNLSAAGVSVGKDGLVPPM
jgi:hypothetical protein